MSDGDARKALTALEVGVLSQAARRQEEGPQGNEARPAGRTRIIFNLEVAKQSIQQKTIEYDGTGDTHYDLASALQKSMRGSDPDACAAEDVGNAEPMAMVLAAAAVQISEFVGLPEAQLALAQAALYVACSPKSNAAASAIWQAMADVKHQPTVRVPKHLKDSHYKAAKKAGFGIDYKYPHNFAGGFVPQEYLPEGATKKYYVPKDSGCEKDIMRYLQKLQTLIQSGKPVEDGVVD
ncbi:MAG: AAA family ATPase [Planctomycetota bacterium]|jgi:putative ATPase